MGVISNAWIARLAGDNVLVYSWVSAMCNIFFLVYIAVGLRILRVPAWRIIFYSIVLVTRIIDILWGVL